MRRAFGIETRLQRGSDRGAVPDVLTPAGEVVFDVSSSPKRLIGEVHAPVVDLDKRCQQVNDGREVAHEYGALRRNLIEVRPFGAGVICQSASRVETVVTVSATRTFPR
jgi:hypothetical protein